MAPMDQPQKSKRLQGGGVLIENNGNVSFNNCQIYDNKASNVSARFLFLVLSSMAPMDCLQKFSSTFLVAGWWRVHRRWHRQL